MEKDDLKALEKVKTPDHVHTKVAALLTAQKRKPPLYWIAGGLMAASFVIGVLFSQLLTAPLPTTITVPNLIYRGDTTNSDTRTIQIQTLTNEQLKELLIELIMLEEYAKAEQVLAVLNARENQTIH